MDIFAHGLWTNAVFYKKYRTDWKSRFWAVAFGVLPDLVSFSPLFIYAYLTRSEFWDLISKNIWVVEYARESYRYTHSIIIFSIAVVIVLLIRTYTSKTHDRRSLMCSNKFIYWPIFGWGLHIVLDIFTHKDFYQTPFLFPLSNYKFDYGISWGEPWFMAVNYGAMVLVYILIYIFNRKGRTM